MTNNKLLYSGNNKCADCTHVNACMRMSIVFDYPFEEIAMYSDRCFAYEPTVEVVRCKDCKFSCQPEIYDPMECNKWATKWGVVYTEPNGFCHKGERREGE